MIRKENKVILEVRERQQAIDNILEDLNGFTSEECKDILKEVMEVKQLA